MSGIQDSDFVADAGFTLISPLVWAMPGLSGGGLRTYLALRDFAGQRGHAFPSHERLGVLLDVSERQVRRYIDELMDLGLVIADRRGCGKTNLYRLADLRRVFTARDVVEYCERKGRKAPEWLVDSLATPEDENDADGPENLLRSPAEAGDSFGEPSDRTDMSVLDRTDPSALDRTNLSYKAYTDEADADEADGASSASAPRSPARSRGRVRGNNPLARELARTGENKIAQRAGEIAHKAAERAEQAKAKRARGRSFRRNNDNEFGVGFGFDDDAGREDPMRTEGDQPDELDEPTQGAPFEAWTEYAASLCRRPKARGGGIRGPDEWTALDLELYLATLSAGFLNVSRPVSTAKSRGQAKRLLSSIGGELARELVDFAVKDWDRIAERLKIDTANYPTPAIIEGYLESLRALMDKGVKKAGSGKDRVEDDYDSAPDEGW